MSRHRRMASYVLCLLRGLISFAFVDVWEVRRFVELEFLKMIRNAKEVLDAK